MHTSPALASEVSQAYSFSFDSQPLGPKQPEASQTPSLHSSRVAASRHVGLSFELQDLPGFGLQPETMNRQMKALKPRVARIFLIHWLYIIIGVNTSKSSGCRREENPQSIGFSPYPR